MNALPCPNCGHELSRTTRFCPDCGARLQSDEGTLVAVPQGPGAWDDVRRSLRDVVEYTRVALGTASSTRLELLRGKRELAALTARRSRALYELGDAAYREDGAAREAASAAVRQLDEAIEAAQAGIEETLRAARERLAQARNP